MSDTIELRVGHCQGAYTAGQTEDGMVILCGAGWHFRSGYRSYFDGEPPEFKFLHIEPIGPALEVITPFCAWTTFRSEPIEFIVVYDAEGEHRVAVQKVPVCKGDTVLVPSLDVTATYRTPPEKE